MFSEEQILRLIRERVDHPATAKELLRLLRVPPRRAGDVQAAPSIAGRVGRAGRDSRSSIRPARSDEPRRRAASRPIRAGLRSSTRKSPGDDGPASIYIAGNNLNQAMHGDRVVVRVEHRRRWRPRRGPDPAHPRARRAAHRRPVRRRRARARVRGAVRSAAASMDVQVPKGEARGATRGEMVTVEITRWPTATRPALGRVVEVLGRLDAPGVDTAVIIRKYNLPDAHSDAAIAEARRLGTAVQRAGHPGAHRFPAVADGDDRRRERARFRRRDFDRSAAERQFLARRAHRGRRALRHGGQRARHGSLRARARRSTFPERAVHMFPHGAVDRALQPESARRSAGAVVPDGGRSPHRRGRALRDARRRDSQPGADDLHGRERDSDGPRSRDDGAIPAARADVRADARAVRRF